MQGILFAEKPRARQLYLDARTKIILCLTVSSLMFSCEYTGVMRFVLPVLAAVPFVSFLILRRYRKAAVYGMVYVLCLMLPMLLRQLDAPVFSIISGALAAIFTQMLPGLAMFDVLLSSTTVSEFIGAMDGFHISKKFSVPVSVMVNGNDTTQLQLHELAGTVGSVFQNPKSQFYTLLTDTEIVFACENIGMEKREILRRFTETVQDFRLEKLLGKNVSQLSGGEKQKIACASVSMLRPPILVLDEPTSNLDISAIRELREIVAKWKLEGKTVLVAEHRLWWLRGLADRVVVFQEGSIVEDVPADEFWRRTPDELHAEGLRGSCRFAPQVKERRADAQYIISPFRSSDGEFTLNIPELKIPKGAVVAVLGNNGAGKSTFARCLCGLVRKCKVQIIDGEKRYAGRKLSSLAYMVFQDVNHQLFSESVSEDVTLGSLLMMPTLMRSLPEVAGVSVVLLPVVGSAGFCVQAQKAAIIVMARSRARIFFMFLFLTFNFCSDLVLCLRCSPVMALLKRAHGAKSIWRTSTASDSAECADRFEPFSMKNGQLFRKPSVFARFVLFFYDPCTLFSCIFPVMPASAVWKLSVQPRQNARTLTADVIDFPPDVEKLPKKLWYFFRLSAGGPDFFCLLCKFPKENEQILRCSFRASMLQ